MQIEPSFGKLDPGVEEARALGCSSRGYDRLAHREASERQAGKERRIVKLARQWVAAWLRVLLLFVFLPPLARGDDDQNNDEYQFNINPHHEIADHLSLFGNFGYYENPNDYSKYRFGWPGLIYGPKDWLQLWGGLDAYYTDTYGSAGTLELRPFAGVKLFVPNKARIFLYNFTRYEYRAIEDLDTHDWDNYSRIRTRFGVEFPLTARAKAWEPNTFYGFTDGEVFYRFDPDEWNPVRVRGGLGYVLNDRVRVEIIYTAQFTRSSPGSSLEFTDNIIQLNIKLALRKGVLGHLFNPGN